LSKKKKKRGHPAYPHHPTVPLLRLSATQCYMGLTAMDFAHYFGLFILLIYLVEGVMVPTDFKS